VAPAASALKIVVGVLVHGEHDDLGAREQRLELAHAFHAVEARQIDVHQGHVRLQLGNFVQRIFGRGMLAHAPVARRTVDQLDQRRTHARIIFHNRNGNAHARGLRSGEMGFTAAL
jgi:hypothetical protein